MMGVRSTLAGTLVSGLALTMLLTGCSRRSHMVAIRALPNADMAAAYPMGDPLAEGRRQLDRQNYGLAISQFRLALQADPGLAAAHNGLAVAYAALGRTDLAQRHFELAVAAAPDNMAYRRNLARLEQEATSPRGDVMLAHSGDMSPGAARGGATFAIADRTGGPALPRSNGAIVGLAPGVALLVTRPETRRQLAARSAATPAAGAGREIFRSASLTTSIPGFARLSTNRENAAHPTLERTDAHGVMLRMAPAGASAMAAPATASRKAVVSVRVASVTPGGKSAEGCASDATQNRPQRWPATFSIQRCAS